MMELIVKGAIALTLAAVTLTGGQQVMEMAEAQAHATTSKFSTITSEKFLNADETTQLHMLGVSK